MNLLGGVDWLESLAKWDGTNFVPLDMPIAILRDLGNPQDSFSSIHIAGTNGKGSVAANIESILVHSRRWTTVAKTISPHAISLTEVACINGEEASLEEIDNSLQIVRETCKKLDLQPSQYVALLIATFCLFKEKKVEVAIVEAGLGGRFDATNVLNNKILNIITSIGIEHEEQLGGTLKEIAWHKAGIITSGVPCVVGEVSEEVLEIIDQHAFHLSSEVIAEERDYQRVGAKLKFGDLEISFKENKLEPDYKLKNKAVSAIASSVLGISKESIEAGLQEEHCPGRFEIYGNPEKESVAVIDVAHNADGILELFSPQCLEYYKSFKRINLVTAFLRRKNWKKMVSSFMDKLDSNCEISLLSMSDECVSLDEIAREFPQLDIKQIGSVSEVEIGNDKEIYIFFGTIALYEHFLHWARSQKLLPVNVHSE